MAPLTTGEADAKALLEAVRNEDIAPVPIKSLEQQAINALHRLRSGYLATRTARINSVRGLLAEFGLPVTVRGRGTDWLPTRESPSWPGAETLHFKGRRYDCSRPSAVPLHCSFSCASGGVQIRALPIETAVRSRVPSPPPFSDETAGGFALPSRAFAQS